MNYFLKFKKKIEGVHKNLSARMFINILKILVNRENKHLQKHRLHSKCQQENVIPSQAVWEGDVKEVCQWCGGFENVVECVFTQYSRP